MDNRGPASQEKTTWEPWRSWDRERKLKEIAASVANAGGPEIEAAAYVLLGSLLVISERPNERRRAVLSLLAVLDFVDTFSVSAFLDVDLPLRGLAAALVDLDQGAMPPSLTPAKVSGRPSSLAERCFRDTAAAAAEFESRGGRTLPDACNYVAKRLVEAGFRLPGRDDRVVTGRTVSAWRKQSLQRPFFGHLVRDWAAAAEGNPKLAAEYILSDLIETLKRQGR